MLFILLRHLLPLSNGGWTNMLTKKELLKQLRNETENIRKQIKHNKFYNFRNHIVKELIKSEEKTKEIVLVIPVIYVDNDWKIDSIDDKNIYQPLFDIYDELNLWDSSMDFILYSSSLPVKGITLSIHLV